MFECSGEKIMKLINFTDDNESMVDLPYHKIYCTY